MMHPAPVVLTHREHLRLIDENSLDALYDNQMLNVARAMYEPEPRRIDKPSLAIWSGLIVFDFLGLYGLYLLIQMIR